MMRSFAATGTEAIVIRKWQSVADVSAMMRQLRLPNIECLGPPKPSTGDPKRLSLARLRQLFGQEQRYEVEKEQLRSLLRWFAKHNPGNWAPAPRPEVKAGHEYATGPRYSQKFASGTAIKAAFSAQELAATSKTKAEAPPLYHLQANEYQQLRTLDSNVHVEKQIKTSNNDPQVWWKIIEDPNILVLSGRDFEQVIRPSSEMSERCRAWETIPEVFRVAGLTYASTVIELPAPLIVILSSFCSRFKKRLDVAMVDTFKRQRVCEVTRFFMMVDEVVVEVVLIDKASPIPRSVVANMWHSQYLFFSGDESLLGVAVLSEEVAVEDDQANVLASFDKLTLLGSLVPHSWPVLTLSMQ
ncbi:hypothetical protein G7054_g5683 [Neopestalotiopsis clavispora]|nr:hypothetical protein G7054_g5683 [Neopestalotiopsis clavispora]